MRLAAVVTLSFLTIAAHGQQTLHVPAQYATIQAAVNAAVTGDTVLVAPGTYSGVVPICTGITIEGSGGAEVTTIVGGMTCNSSSTQALVRGFTITGGSPGIYIERSSPRFENCIVTGNAGFDGGGVQCRSTSTTYVTSPEFVNCLIVGNYATARGGGASFLRTDNYPHPEPRFENCTIEGNFGLDFGGGIYAQNALITLEDCRVLSNSAQGSGGGIFGSSYVVRRCVFRGNQALLSANPQDSDGGAVSGDVSIWDSQFSGNSAHRFGGAIASSGFIIERCTVAENVASLAGGVFVNTGGNPISLRNSIVYGNVGGDVMAGAPIAVIGPSFIGVGGPFTAASLSQFSTADPGFVDPANGDFHLSQNSPCRDAGDPNATNLPVADFDGTPRVVGAAIDIGCDEVPAQQFPGTGEDLDIYVKVNEQGDPLASSATAAAGDLVHVLVRTPGGSFAGTTFLLAAEVGPTGYQSYFDPFFPSVHLYPTQAFVLAGSTNAGPFAAPGFPPNGLDLYYQIPPGLGGYTIRLQGFAITAFSANGIFACSNARDVNL